METIVNRVAQSALITLDLDDFIKPASIELFDLEPLLFQGMILREKDFRDFVKKEDWAKYKGKYVGLFCSTEAIIPSWAYMILITKLQPVCEEVVVGEQFDLEKKIIDQALAKIPFSNYQDAKIVIKGCGGVQNRDYAFAEVTKRLVPFASSIMYGEPCSTVPVFKRKN